MSQVDDLIRQINRLEAKIENLIQPENGRWVDWTPTIDQGGAVAATIVYARYILQDGGVKTQIKLSITGTGITANEINIGGQPSIMEPANVGVLNVIGNGVIQDAGAATIHQGSLVANATGQWKIYADLNGGALGSTPAFPLQSTDIISFTAIYER